MSNTIKPVDNPMLTKIGDKVGGTREALSSTGSQRVEKQAPDAAPGRSDTVELTSDGQLMERLEQTLKAMPEIDPARVEAVKDAIANGDYRIDADRIADALLRFDREFGN